jgi:hypothetical protein
VHRTFFHFTAGHLMPGILRTGLTKGVLPWSMDKFERVGLKAGWQWLTESSEWSQEWARPSPFSTLPYRRDEVRITIRFPEVIPGQLVSWREVDRRCRPDSADFINTFADAPKWWLYHGVIPPVWFTAIEATPIAGGIITPVEAN